MSGSFTSRWAAAMPAVGSPTSAARVLPWRADAKTSAALAVPFETSSTVGSVTAPSVGPAIVTVLLSRPASVAIVPFLTKILRGRDAVGGRAVGRAAQVDDEARGSVLLRGLGDLLERRGRVVREARDADIGLAARQLLARDGGAGSTRRA